jgi:DNA helicase-2/ATP-dependent DNA helicase PcrA
MSEKLAALLAGLNDKQLLAVKHDTGPALVLAGAGSGKTRVLTTRVAYLLATKKLLPDEILLVTFTNKAAAEMKSRVQNLIGVDLAMAGTFHALAVRMLRRFAPSVKLDYNFTIYDSDDQLTLLKQIYRDNGWSVKEFKPQGVKAAISGAKNQLITPEVYRETAQSEFGRFVANAYILYQRRLRLENALDFDDLLNVTLEMLENDAYVRRVYQEKIKYVLVDEYQDTNIVQYRLSQILAAPQNNIFVVGDFSQSIYAWRGADYKNMWRLKEDYPDLTTYHLDQNYRSVQPILTAATKIIKKDTDYPVLNLWTQNRQKSKLIIYDCETGEGEARTVGKEIEKLRSEYDLSEMAILYRTNAQSRSFEEALTRFALPYRLVGGFKFYERKEIKDLLAYLRLYLNPKESVSLVRAKKIGKRRLDNYLQWRAEYQAKDSPNNSITVILEEILMATKYRDFYDSDDPEELAKLENINELLAHASQFEEISEFLENVALIQDDYDLTGKRRNDLARDEVTLMSLHSAKGLEFKVVFLVGMEENLLPHARSLFDKEQLAEERRLCYVGITRAKEKLYFTHARKRWLYGGVGGTMRSRFLDDLSDDLVEVVRLEESEGRENYKWQKKRFPFLKKPKVIKIPNSNLSIDLEDTQLDELLNGDGDFEKFLRK